ncbi:MAG: COG1615 family transporter, partial [Thaumarchaeota archaeon]|nr:COG1615 family transporter [Nitrososphaerota archaeon]
MILYSASTDKQAPPPDAGKYIRLAIIAIMGIAIFATVGNQAVILSMNFSEFGDQFTKPLFYTLLSTIILSIIALVRVNISGRSSIFWYAVSTGIGLIGQGQQQITNNIPSFRDYKLSSVQFVIWQITKIFLFGAFFANIMFGFAVMSFIDGNTLGIENLPKLFSLPFVTPETNPNYAAENVVPMIPALVILIPPILAAIGLRLVLYVGIHRIINVITSFLQDSNEGKPRFLNYVSTIEGIIGIGIIWAGFNLFFTDQIDYNTRYVIGGTLLVGSALITFSIIDRIRARVLTHMFKRDVYIRILTILAIAIIVVGVVSVNNSIADAKKIEFLGPYTAQQIGVNRYLGELNDVQENIHDPQLTSVSPNNINNYIKQNSDVLDVIRIWDWEAAFAKLKPEIGLIPYVNFEDNDILRFNNTLYWTASMKPILPTSVSLENRWYNEHLVYTHVPNGFLTLEATDGQIVDSGEFFKQREIYYGEGGLFETTWSGYPNSRGSDSAELGGVSYSGLGGLDVSPPLSWIFEPNFLLSFPSESVHIMRYKDVNDRMEILYPYFLYDLFGQELDSLPVTDGTNSYWLIPLIIGFDTHDVPWSVGNPYLRLVGYALVDSYNGDIQLLKTGDDFFSEMFASQYSEHFQPMPTWLEEQIRYPVELFNWKTEMYNIYHVDNVETFIQANEFYEIPRGLDTYYVEAKPPGFEQTEFLGLLSLELRGSEGRNLAGYMVVENDLTNLGDLQFYEIPLNSTTKLIGPTAVREALDRDPEFAQLKTLLRNPRIGDNILYRVGNHDVYFIPVYTAGAGGVVAQLGTIAAVGAAFNGEYFVGLGETQEAAFEAYLKKVSGVASSVTVADSDYVELVKDDRIDIIKLVFEENGISIAEPTTIQIPLSFNEGEMFFFTESDQVETEEFLSQFIDDFVKPRSDRVFMWQEENNLNVGTILVKDGIPEIHYV